MATETSTSPCPCGSGSPEAACCAPLLAGAAAASPEALMRSRYTAYVRGAIDYVVDTNDPATRDGIDREASAAWSRETQWQGLEILSTRKGGPDDDEGDVEFIARGTTEGKPFAHHERSRFRRLDGRWYYMDDQGKAEPLRKTTPDIGRNEPCPCGSGKKYKRCHGARPSELQPIRLG